MKKLKKEQIAPGFPSNPRLLVLLQLRRWYCPGRKELSVLLLRVPVLAIRFNGKFALSSNWGTPKGAAVAPLLRNPKVTNERCPRYPRVPCGLKPATALQIEGPTRAGPLVGAGPRGFEPLAWGGAPWGEAGL